MARTFTALTVWLCFLIFTHPISATPITENTAAKVAENTIRHHIDQYHDWSGATSAQIELSQIVTYKDQEIAYNFPVAPSGHILVAADDAFAPVLLYSTTSSFNIDRLDQKESIESWIIKEQYNAMGYMETMTSKNRLPVQSVKASQFNATNRIEDAWRYFSDSPSGMLSTKSGQQSSKSTSTTVGPLLTTKWSQSSPYNMYTPSDNGCSNTLAGCVAIAFAQVTNYWQWPPMGKGTHSYSWKGRTLSADFASDYVWESMPSKLTSSSSSQEKSAVGHLVSDMGIAVNMQYGCNSSGSSAWADEILDTYFRYKPSMNRLSRSSRSASEWFSLIKTELDANPPRPVVFSIFGDGFGHETVADGYQTGLTDKVHINFGWSGVYNGYYDITHNFSTGGYEWHASSQVIVTGIEPDNETPIADAGTDSQVFEGENVELAGIGLAPVGSTIVSYEWTQISGPRVTVETPSDEKITFDAPDVATSKALSFRLRVTDSNGLVGEDICVVTVKDPTAAPADNNSNSANTSGSSSKGSGGGGGCFISTILN